MILLHAPQCLAAIPRLNEPRPHPGATSLKIGMSGPITESDEAVILVNRLGSFLAEVVLHAADGVVIPRVMLGSGICLEGGGAQLVLRARNAAFVGHSCNNSLYLHIKLCSTSRKSKQKGNNVNKNEMRTEGG